MRLLFAFLFTTLTAWAQFPSFPSYPDFRPSGYTQPNQVDSLVVWLEWDQEFTPSQWNDLSGNGFHAKQPTAGAQPSIGADGVTFDQDWMRIGEVTSGAFGRFWDNGYSVIVRFKMNASAIGEQRWIVSADSNSGGIRNWVLRSDVTTDSLHWITWPPTQTPTDNLTGRPDKAVAGQWQTLTAIYDGTVKHLWIDSGPEQTSTPSGGVDNNDDPPIYLGSGRAGVLPWEGMISHLLIYSRALTDDERTALVQYVENN